MQLTQRHDAILTSENYKQGYLIDEECMGGITQSKAQSSVDSPPYIAFVIQHESGLPSLLESFVRLEDALAVLNRLERSWSFEPIKKKCAGSCKKSEPNKLACQAGNCGSCC